MSTANSSNSSTPYSALIATENGAPFALTEAERHEIEHAIHHYEDPRAASIDALKIVSNGVNSLRSKDNATIVITHYQRLLDYIVPDFVHVLYKGRIVKSGGKELALELESRGYDWVKEEAGE